MWMQECEMKEFDEVVFIFLDFVLVCLPYLPGKTFPSFLIVMHVTVHFHVILPAGNCVDCLVLQRIVLV